MSYQQTLWPLIAVLPLWVRLFLPWIFFIVFFWYNFQFIHFCFLRLQCGMKREKYNEYDGVPWCVYINGNDDKTYAQLTPLCIRIFCVFCSFFHCGLYSINILIVVHLTGSFFSLSKCRVIREPQSHEYNRAMNADNDNVANSCNDKQNNG